MTLNIDVLVRDIKIAYKRWNSSAHDVEIPSKGTESPSKSTTKAHAFREAGNMFYRENKLEEALLSYTMSVAYALLDSEELCKAYGNRSAVLFEWAKYVPCLLDLNRALNSHCQSSLRQKLQDRKERCLARMKSSTGIGSGADDEIDADAINPVDERENLCRANMMSKFGNSLLPNASPKIKLKFNEKWGRHFVATADIKPGEPLMSENYFVTVVFSDDNRFKCCDLCLKPCSALIPCLSCAGTMYCSEQCRTRAYDTYHRMECKLSLLIPCNSVTEAIGIRMFLIGTEQGAALENLMRILTIPDIFVENFNFADKSTGSDYLTALRLTHRPFDSAQVKSHVKDAVKVVTALRKLAFFKSFPAERLKDAEVFAVALLVNNIGPRFINSWIVPSGTASPNIKRSIMWEGVLLLQYFFNHSCYPNIWGYRRRRENILFAVRPIKKDEQLFCSYTDDFIKAPKAERIKKIDLFVCRCEACSHNWPSYVESGFSQMTSPADVLLKMIEGCEPSFVGCEPGVLPGVFDVVAPLLDDTTLVNLRVNEILTIITKIISLLDKAMTPWSFGLVRLRYYLKFFIELYYDERECDLSWNKSLKFHKNLRDNEELLKIFMRMIPINIFILKAMLTLSDVFGRLNVYMSQCQFIEKKMID